MLSNLRFFLNRIGTFRPRFGVLDRLWPSLYKSGSRLQGARTKRGEKPHDYLYLRWRGEIYLAGFEWTGDKPGFFSQCPMHLEWRQAHIVTKRKIEQDCHVLAQIVAGQIGIELEGEGWRGATRVLLRADEDQHANTDPHYWSIVFSDGRPAYARELVSNDLDWLRNLVQDECTKGSIDRLIAPEDFLSAIRAQKVMSNPLEQSDSRWKLPEEEPLFLNGRYQPVLLRTVLAVPLIAALLLGVYIMLLLDPDKRVLVRLGLEEPPVKAAIIHPHVIDWLAFANACEEIQAISWPASPGWEMVTSGCTARGMQDPNHQPFFPMHEAGSAYRIYRILPEHHEWLTIQAARITTRNWDGEITFSPQKMVLSRQLDVKLLPWEGRDYNLGDLLEHAHRHFLGTAEHIEETPDWIIMRTSVRDRNVFPILEEIKAKTPFGIYAISRTRGELELALGPPNIIQLEVLP